MTNKEGQTQSLNLTNEELKAVSFGLQWSYTVTANSATTEREWKQKRKIIESVLKKIKVLTNGSRHDED